MLNIDGKTNGVASQSVLMMEIGSHHIFYGILNKADQQLVKAAFYTGSHQQDEEVLLQQVVDKHTDLQDNYFQVICSFSIPRQLLVPEKFYQDQSAQTLLDLLHGAPSDGKLIIEKVDGYDFHNIYQVPLYAYDWVQRQYSNAKFFHTYTTGVRSLNLDDEAASQVVIDFKPYHFTVYVIKLKQLQLVQMFPYEAPADVVFYLAKICFQFGLRQDEVKVKVEGLVDAASPAYQHLEKYFHHVSFASGPEHIRMHEHFNAHPPHYYSSLYKMALCVS